MIAANRRLLRFGGWLLLPVAGACTLTSLDGAFGGPLSDAGGGESGASAAPADASSTPIEDAADAAPCVRGPTAILDDTADGSVAFTCDLANAIVLDGKLAGLDSHSGAPTNLAGEAVYGCLETRFDSDIGSRIRIDATTVNSACGVACGTCVGDAQLKVFAGPSSGALEYLGLVTVEHDAGIAPYTLFHDPSHPARVIVVCAAPTGSYVDPAIDAVATDCL